MYSNHSEGNSVPAENFIRTLMNEIYKYMNLISKNVYIDKLDDNTYYKTINTYYKTIEMKPADVKSSSYIDSNKEVNDMMKILN